MERPTNRTDLSHIAEMADFAIREAGRYLLQKFGHAKIESQKELRDDLLDADLGAERIILDILRKEFPNYGILSEEAGDERKDIISYWIVDPLDGSANYQHGNPIFASSIALIINNVPTLGVIYLPARDELFTAIRGSGATLNGKPIQLSNTSKIEEAIIHIGEFERDHYQVNRQQLKELTIVADNAKRMRVLGTSCTDLAWLARGRSNTNTTDLFVRLCQWLWKRQSFFWSTVILGIVVNFVSTWLLQSQSTDYSNSPLGLMLSWMSQHIVIVLCIGILILLIDIMIYLVSRLTAGRNEATIMTSVAPIVSNQIFPLGVMEPTGMPLIQLTDRVAQLERIKRVIYNGESGGVCAITGINGVGKTVLAARAVRELSEDTLRFPGGALWIRCENLKGVEGFNELCLRIARRLHIDLLGKDIRQDSLEQMRDRLSHILSVRPCTLLALDNMEPELDVDAVTKMLVLPGHTSLLITTLWRFERFNSPRAKDVAKELEKLEM